MTVDPAGEFRTITMKKFAEAEQALHDGDPEPRIALWSQRDPVTLRGAGGGPDQARYASSRSASSAG